jgi:methyltransferase family protein
VDFATYALSQLPPAPARVLEVGCGEDGGVTPALAAAGYDAVAVDPRAPPGRRYRRLRFQELAGESYEAVVAERVLHHVHPLAASVDKLAELAPLLVVDEFAWDRIDEPTRQWYEARHRELRARGEEPKGPAGIDEWQARWTDLHPANAVRRALLARYDERAYEARPYFYRWLGADVETLEAELVAAGTIQAIGFRWVGVARGWITTGGAGTTSSNFAP